MAGTVQELHGRAIEILEDRNFAHVSIPRDDGSIHSVVVWADVTDDGNLLINGAEGRDWPALIRRARRTTVTVLNLENPYEYVVVEGRLESEDHDDADRVIDSLAKKYLDEDTYPFRQPGERRVSFVIAPERVRHYGGG